MAKKSINIRAGFDMKAFSTSSQNLTRSLKSTGKKMQSVGKSMSMSLTAPIVALGGLAVKTFADFEQSMAKVKAISGATGKDFEALTQTAKDLGISTRFAASEVSDLMLNYSKLGFSSGEIQKITASTLDLALATGEDLATSAMVAGGTLRAFGLDASKMGMVTDVMAKSFSSSALDLNKFQVSMSSIAPVAKGLGQSLQETTAQLGVLVNNGIEASTAGTMLRNMMLKATKDGFSMDEALKDIASSTDKAGTSLKYFDTRATATALVLADNIKAVKGLNDELLDSSGSAKDMADIMDKTLEGSMMKLKSATEGMGIAFGEILAPAIGEIANFLSDIAMKFSELSDGTKTTIVVVAALAAAIGPLLLVMGTLLTMAPAIGAAFTLMTGPVGIAVVAITALIVGLSIATSDANDKTKELNRTQKLMSSTSEKYQKNLDKEKSKMLLAFNILKATNKGSDERKNLINEINDTYGTTLKNLDDEKAFVKQLDSSYADLIKSMTKKVKLSLKEDVLRDLVSIENDITNSIENIDKSIKDAFGPMGQLKIQGSPDSTFGSDDAQRHLEELYNAQKKFTKELAQNKAEQAKIFEGNFLKDIAPTPPSGSTTKKIIKSVEDSLDGMVVPMPKLDFSKLNIGNPNDLVKVEPIEIDVKVNKDGFNEVIEKLGTFATTAQIKALELGQEMGAALTTGLRDLATEGLVSFGQFIGDVMSGGDMTVQDFGRGLLDSIGKFMGQFGEAMIAMGIAQTLLDVAIKSGNGPLAIIGGVALVAAGAAISNLSKKGVDSGSSAPAPSYSGSGSAFNNSDNGYSFENNITLSGRDMIITQKRERAFGR